MNKVLNIEYKKQVFVSMFISFLIHTIILVSIYSSSYFSDFIIYDVVAILIMFIVSRFKMLQKFKIMSFFKKTYIRWPLGIIMWVIMFITYMSIFKSIDPYYLLALCTSTYLAFLIVRKPTKETIESQS